MDPGFRRDDEAKQRMTYLLKEVLVVKILAIRRRQ